MSIDLEDLKIPFNDIKLATKNFGDQIGSGGFGNVYKGELSISGKLTPVAVKRLNDYGQGNKEFLTEAQILSRYKHPNVVSLLRVCNEGDERILIYQYAERKSLDKYLCMTKNMLSLTWMQRINICIDAARGLYYLHNHVAENQRVIHRDIKSANILLDHNWKALIADFGLSKVGGKNENDSYIVTLGAGTFGYLDPLYFKNDILTKESDVYSFGMVLFEVLCGRLANEMVDDKKLYEVAPRYYQDGRFKEIIDPYLKDQMGSESFNKILRLANQCVQKEGRPLMNFVVQELEEALKLLVQDPSMMVKEELRQELHDEMDARVTAIAAREKAIKDREKAMEDQKRAMKDRETTMANREKAIEARERQMEDQEKNVSDRETTAYDREVALYNREKAMDNREINASNREINVSNRETAVYNREVAVSNREKAMED